MRRAVTSRLVHPTAPVLLTKTWPTKHTDILYVDRHGPKGKGRPDVRTVAMTSCKNVMNRIRNVACSSYPEGNFGGNQLLDGSIGLSPLCPILTIDLHVRTASVLHQGIVHHLSGHILHTRGMLWHRGREAPGMPGITPGDGGTSRESRP
ncbi:unnamed protein product [Wuchereria bancrofti]|uniref:Uncharacterized protein n=1 Tax=Wuchereria bancrofti TaxID=6293 RepID=A0A3P7FNW9_WUCBA|nr:unnamed protein product [Wuchereria bancrofti]